MSQKHIVFIHGFLENASMWKHVLGHLSKKEFAIHTVELAGHGTRGLLNTNATMADFAKDIYQQIEKKKGEKTMLIGHSMGGYAALELCKLLGHDVSSLCMFHSTARADSIEKKEARDRAIEAVKKNKSLYTRTMISSLFSEKNKTNLRSQIEKNIVVANAIETAAIINSLNAMRNRNDHLNWLLQRSFPLYYFLGDEDARLPLTEMHEELNQLPGAVSEIIPNIGHMGHLECLKQASSFIQRVIRADM